MFFGLYSFELQLCPLKKFVPGAHRSPAIHGQWRMEQIDRQQIRFGNANKKNVLARRARQPWIRLVEARVADQSSLVATRSVGEQWQVAQATDIR